MNARGVNALAGVIHAAMKTHATAAGIAMAVDAAGLLMSPEKATEVERLRADADRLTRVAEREHKAFLDTHNALNVLREDANRVMAEHGVEALQAELERVRAKAVKFKEQRGERTRFLAVVSADLERAKARVTELEQQLATATGATYREGARLLESTGRDDDAVNLLDNMADAHLPGGTAAAPVPVVDRVVAYTAVGGRVLRHPACAPSDLTGYTPLTPDDLPDGGICTRIGCGRDVLAGGEPRG